MATIKRQAVAKRTVRYGSILSFMVVANIAFLVGMPLLIAAVHRSVRPLGFGRSEALRVAEVAPLALACLLASIGPGRVSVRAGAFVLASLITSVSILFSRWPLCPTSGMLAGDLIESAVLFVPASFIIAALGAVAKLRLGSEKLPAQRVTIAGFLFAMAAIGAVLAWAFHRERDLAEVFDYSQALADASQREVALVALGFSPIAGLLIVFSAWCGSSKVGWSLLPLPPLAIAFTLLQLDVPIQRAAEFTAGVVVVMVWVSTNVACLSIADWRLSRRENVHSS